MMKFFPIFKVFLMLGIIVRITGCGRESTMSDMDFARQLGAGWNLGNSLEATCDDNSCSGNDLEEYWQNPATTREMIHAIKKAGFQTIRIPITWENHMDENNKIDAEWMERVKEVVEYALSENMYVIINSHHDKCFQPYEENRESALFMMGNLWKQVADAFEKYDNRLLFEGMNEPRCIGTDIEWNGGNKATAAIVNQLNQKFVDTVRSRKGYNKSRYLLVTTYGDSTEEVALKYFKMPQGEKIIVTVHAYIPVDFAMNEQGEIYWRNEMKDSMEALMDRLHTRFIANDIPVIIGEFGSIDKNNTKDRVKWAKAYVETAKKRGIPCFWWDEGGRDGNTSGKYQIFDRNSLTWLFPELKAVLVKQ